MARLNKCLCGGDGRFIQAGWSGRHRCLCTTEECYASTCWHKTEAKAEAAWNHLTTAPSDGKAATAEPGEGILLGAARAAFTPPSRDPHPEWPQDLKKRYQDCWDWVDSLAQDAPPSAPPSKELIVQLRKRAAECEVLANREDAALLDRAADALSQPPVTDAGKGERYRTALERLALPLAFLNSRMTTAEERARMFFAEYVLAGSTCEEAEQRARAEATEEKPIPSSEGDEG